MLDPSNQDDEDVLKSNCNNVSIQRNRPKKTLLGNSQIHGFGLYTGEDVKVNDFLGEYKGEIITEQEAERRGAIYSHQKTMYLFTVCKGQEIDSARAGNKIRFINNASEENSNCRPRTLLCDGVVRIALFAKKAMKAGTELFFYYNYDESMTQNFSEPIKSGKGIARKKTKATLPSITSHPKLTQKPSVRKSRLSTPERRAQTAKGRAARAAKRDGKDVEEPPSSHPKVTQRPRKSMVTSNATIARRIQRHHAEDNDRAAENAKSSSSSRQTDFQETIQETDPEDEEMIDTSDDEEAQDENNAVVYEIPVSESEEEASPVPDDEGSRRKLRNSVGGLLKKRAERDMRKQAMAPPKPKRTTRGRPGSAAKKRKRGVVDDDENE